eukprot:1050014-Pelagomonas_calceolata.AAC.1
MACKYSCPWAELIPLNGVCPLSLSLFCAAGLVLESHRPPQEHCCHVLHGVDDGQQHPDLQHNHDLQPPCSAVLGNPGLRPK